MVVLFFNPSIMIQVNRTVFLGNKVWYLSIVDMIIEKVAFWSHHNRDGLTDAKASNYFTDAHRAEVRSLMKQYIENGNSQNAGRTLQLENENSG